MEGQKDTLKVYRHHQHSRIQKEGDEMWISSEDLRTEGSSDEETHAGAGASTSRSRRTKKNRKQRKSTAVEASKSTTSTTSQPDEEKSTAETNIDINIRRFSILDNPFFTDIFPDSAAGASAISLGSTDSGVDALNLESRWRPKRGSLKYPILVEGQTTVNYQQEIDGFFTEMMSKLKSLRSRPTPDGVLAEVRGLESREDAKLLKRLKHTPEVKEKLKYIERLEEEIKDTIQVYKEERAERLQVQKEMCDDIYQNSTYLDKDSRTFLELCRFDEINDESVLKKETDNKEAVNPGRNTTGDNSFIKRNIELASKGVMACFSLTDEEKKQLEELLVDEQEDCYRLDDDLDKKDSGMDLEEDADENYFSNAYSVDEDDKRRIEDINSELEKFALDETENEKVERTESKQRQSDWKDSLLLDQRLKSINAKLEELRRSFDAAGNAQPEEVNENEDEGI